MARGNLPRRQTPNGIGGLQPTISEPKTAGERGKASWTHRTRPTSAMERHWHGGDSMVILSRLLIRARIDSCQSLQRNSENVVERNLLFVHDMQLQHRDRANFAYVPPEDEEWQPKLHSSCLLRRDTSC